MKVFFNDIIPKIRRYSQKLDNVTILTQKHWVLIDDQTGNKVVYIFRPNSELIISISGKVEKGKWEYLGQGSILVDNSEGSFLLRNEFVDDTLLALKVDGKEQYAIFINEKSFSKELNTILKIESYLKKKYLTGYSGDVDSNKDEDRSVLLWILLMLFAVCLFVALIIISTQ